MENMETTANSPTQNKGEGWSWANKKPNNIIPIQTTLDTEFFKWWCIFLRPFIPLTNRETDVMACFLKHRYELSLIINDPAALDILIMSEDTKRKVIEECNITLQHFYVVMSNLRKHKVILGNVINPRLIPNIRKGDNGIFQLLILFKDKLQPQV